MIAAGALLPKCFSSGSQGELFSLCGAIANAPTELRYSFHSPDAGNQFCSASRYRPPRMPGAVQLAGR